MRKLLTFALLFLAAPLLGADIRQITPPAGQSQAVLQAPIARGTWIVRADEDLAEVSPQLVADASLAILQAAPGRYHVRWRQGPLKPWQAAVIDLGVSPGPGPKPVDPPQPPVDPPVVPTAKIVQVVVIEEATDNPPDDVDVAAIRLSGATGEIAALAKKNGWKWRMVDQNTVGPDGKTPPAWAAPFLREAKGRTLPWLIAVGESDSDGAADPVISARCPKDVAGVLKILGAK